MIVAPRWYPSTRTCCACGTVTLGRMDLAQRVFRCPSCGTELDRDLNAARNLLAVAESYADTQNACGEGVSALSERLPSSNQEPMIRRTDGESENGGTTTRYMPGVDLVDLVLLSDDREE